MIGCGSFAIAVHGPAQQRYSHSNKNVELAACCDVDEGRSREYARLFGFKRHYCDIDEALAAENPDAVILAVPPSATCAMAGPVLERGFPLLLEKPPGLSSAELQRLVASAKKGGVGAQVAFNRRFMPVMRRARRILDAEFPSGALKRVDYRMLRSERWDPDFSTTAIHAIDSALFLAGSPFHKAHINSQELEAAGRGAHAITIEAECVSGCHVLIDIQPVTGVNLESAWVHAVGQSVAIKIPFSPFSPSEGTLEHWSADRIVATFSDSSADSLERFGVFDETKAFLEAVASGDRFTPALGDCYQQVALMEAIRLNRLGPVVFGPA
jgi:myo-inositol 2-dehydrogenase / D-chiro-inositol 1-dehydrogenase